MTTTDTRSATTTTTTTMRAATDAEARVARRGLGVRCPVRVVPGDQAPTVLGEAGYLARSVRTRTPDGKHFAKNAEGGPVYHLEPVCKAYSKKGRTISVPSTRRVEVGAAWLAQAMAAEAERE